MTITREEELALLDPASYHRNGYPWKTWEKLRREAPVHHIDKGNGEAYWVVTRYQDIVDIERNAEVFKNGPKLTIGVEGQNGLRMIVAIRLEKSRLLSTVYVTPVLPNWSVKRWP